MKKDFHYYCIGVLARVAGFSPEDAITIAYASQYVDDSTESEPIQVGDMKFDPVRTAHIGLKAFDWSVQKRIYIPFHFLPPGPIYSPKDTFIVHPGSLFALNLLEEARNETSGGMPRLCRIGVALHTLADTWAHQGFSGREHKENDVESISFFQEGKWRKLLWENVYLDLLPQIGHAEALDFPDRSGLVWRYKRGLDNKTIQRETAKEFFLAAQDIYLHLDKMDKSPQGHFLPWKEIKEEIQTLLGDQEENTGKRCDKWRKQFGGMFSPLNFNYNPQAWRNDALNPPREADTDWNSFKPSDFGRLRFPMKPGFYKSPWVQFHRAALRQRHLVLENLL